MSKSTKKLWITNVMVIEKLLPRGDWLRRISKRGGAVARQAIVARLVG